MIWSGAQCELLMGVSRWKESDHGKARALPTALPMKTQRGDGPRREYRSMRERKGRTCKSDMVWGSPVSYNKHEHSTEDVNVFDA